MGLLHCPKCKHDISATEKQCPACGTKISLFNELKFQIEHNHFQLVLLVITALLALGAAWFWRMDGGSKWPLYVVIVLVAPLVPWVLKTAYSIAAPVPDLPESPVATPANTATPPITSTSTPTNTLVDKQTEKK